MSGDTPTLTSEIARVVHLGAVADEYADARNEPDAVSDDAGDLGDTLRQLGGRLRWLVNKQEAEHRAVSTVLAAVAEVLEDPARPEESPVDAARRLRAEVARLTPDTPGAVSDHVRSRFAAASAATLAGEGGCIGAGCIPAHQACEALDAYDDARAEVERLTADVQKLRRDLCQAWGLDELGQRFPGQAARDRAARAVAKRQAWDCYPEDSTTVEPTLHDCIGMAEALAEGDEESPI